MEEDDVASAFGAATMVQKRFLMMMNERIGRLEVALGNICEFITTTTISTFMNANGGVPGAAGRRRAKDAIRRCGHHVGRRVSQGRT
jgi:hypothetical protein